MEIDRFDIKKAVEWKDKLEQNCSLEEILWIIRNISYDYVSYYSAKDNGYIYQPDEFDEEHRWQAYMLQRKLSSSCDLFGQSIVNKRKFEPDYFEVLLNK